MKTAGIDLGTNTCLCLVAEVEGPPHSPRLSKILSDEVEIVRLGQEVDKAKRLHPDALERVDQTLARFSATIRRLGVEKVLACATSAARDSQNREELIEIGRRHGIPIEIISGEKEAELTFLGTADHGEQVSSDREIAIIDVGGGSTEIMFGSAANGIRDRISLDVGAVRLTERTQNLFSVDGRVPEAALEKMRQSVREAVAKSGFLQKPKTRSSPFVIGVAGTPTTLAAVDQGRRFTPESVHNYRLTSVSIKNWTDRLSNISLDERKALPGMEPKRADVLIAGLICLLEAQSAISQTVEQRHWLDEMHVSVRGLRYGVVRWIYEREKLSQH